MGDFIRGEWREKIYQPRIVKKVQEKDGTVVMEEPPKLRHDLTKEGITAQQIEIVKKGMWRVVNEAGGTAGRAKSQLTTISGKTGTAQTANPKQPTNAWFISFAPYDEPEIAVCVFVENGKSGGGAASPIAKNVIDHHFAMKEGKELEVTALKEAVGNTYYVASVSFDSDSKGLLAFAPGANQQEVPSSSEESAVDVQAFVPRSIQKRTYTPVQKSYTTPTIKQKVDSRGRVASTNKSRPKPKFQPFKNMISRMKANQAARRKKR